MCLLDQQRVVYSNIYEIERIIRLGQCSREKGWGLYSSSSGQAQLLFEAGELQGAYRIDSSRSSGSEIVLFSG